MIFNNKLEEFQYNPSGTILSSGSIISNNDDLFFRSKQTQIYDQYTAARLYMRETEFIDDNSLNCLLSVTKMFRNDDDIKLYLQSLFYESALLFYNIVIDLTWVLTYSCIERYFIEQNYTVITLKGIQDVRSARAAMECLENHTVGPDDINNPFIYIVKQAPMFTPVVDIVIEFWKNHHDSDIRSMYNYIKHKGKPFYTEMSDNKFFNSYAYNKTSITKLASSISDVSKQVSLIKSIEELRDFDDNELFFYVNNLIKELENIIIPGIV